MIKKYKFAIFLFCLILLNNNVFSQIVYTDVNPDSTVYEFSNGFAVDFDNNGKIDVHLVLLADGGIYVMRLIPDDAADYTYVINEGGNDGGAKIINYGDEISSSTNMYQVGSGWGDLLYGHWPSKSDYGYWTGTQTNKYLGFKFEIGSEFHYGWIYLTTNVYSFDNMDFTIQSYAYNSVPDELIFAGDEGDGVIVTTPVQDEINVEFNAIVSVNFSYDISVVDLSGIEIKDTSNNSVSGVSAVLEADNRTITISHDDFAENMVFTVTIPENSVQNTALVGNDEIIWDFTTKVADGILEQNLVANIFPNPTTGVFTVTGNNLKTSASSRPLRVEIIDVSGKVIILKSVNSSQKFDLTGYPKGIYIVKCKNQDGISISKLVLQ